MMYRAIQDFSNPHGVEYESCSLHSNQPTSEGPSSTSQSPSQPNQNVESWTSEDLTWPPYTADEVDMGTGMADYPQNATGTPAYTDLGHHQRHMPDSEVSFVTPQTGYRSTSFGYGWRTGGSSTYKPDFCGINMFTGKPFKNNTTPAFKRENEYNEGYSRAAKRARIMPPSMCGNTYWEDGYEYGPSNSYASSNMYGASAPTINVHFGIGISDDWDYSAAQHGLREYTECEVYDVTTPGIEVLLHKPCIVIIEDDTEEYTVYPWTTLRP